MIYTHEPTYKITFEDLLTFSLLWLKHMRELICNRMFLFMQSIVSVPVGLCRTLFMVDKKQKFQSIMAGTIKPEQDISHHGGQERKEQKQEGSQARCIFPSMCPDEAFPLNKHHFPQFHTLSVIYSDI